MNDRTWEIMMQEELSQMPLPEGLVQGVTPWRKAMKRILIGLALNTVTFRFFCLQYLLPTLGLVMMWLGFRTLRRTNRWFTWAWIITTLQMGITFPVYWINVTYRYQDWVNSSFAAGRTWPVIMLEGMLILCLWQGIRIVQKDAGTTPHAGGGLALLVWYGLLFGLAWIQAVGGWVAVIMLTAYGMILIHLYRLFYELDDVGYVMKASSVRVSDGLAVAMIAGIMAIGLTVGHVGFSSYPMEWSVVEPVQGEVVEGITEEISEEIDKIKEQLITLGFPETVLQDLSQEDILACKGAEFVFCEMEEEAFTEKRFFARVANRSLEVTMVAVQLPGDPVRYRFFHHFQWSDDSTMLQRDAVEIVPAYKEDGMWGLTTECTGYALYDQDGTVYRSSLYDIKEKQDAVQDWFENSYNRTTIWAGVSYPLKDAGRCRGYLTYEAVALQEEWKILTATYYYHQTDWFQYPFQSKLKHSFTRLDGYYTEVERSNP